MPYASPLLIAVNSCFQQFICKWLRIMIWTHSWHQIGGRRMEQFFDKPFEIFVHWYCRDWHRFFFLLLFLFSFFIGISIFRWSQLILLLLPPHPLTSPTIHAHISFPVFIPHQKKWGMKRKKNKKITLKNHNLNHDHKTSRSTHHRCPYTTKAAVETYSGHLNK